MILICTLQDISVKIVCLFTCGEMITLESRELDVSPAKTEVKQGKFVSFISPAKGYFRETYKSPNINPFSPTPKITMGIIQIKVKSLSTSFSVVSSIKT